MSLSDIELAILISLKFIYTLLSETTLADHYIVVSRGGVYDNIYLTQTPRHSKSRTYM